MSGKHDRQRLLANVALFSACTDKELDRLARHAEIVDPEQPLTHAFFMISGVASLIVNLADGASVEVASVGREALAYVGEMALLDPGPRTATVTALRDTQTVLLSSREFYAAIDDVPGLARKLLAGMAKRLRTAQAHPPVT